MTIDSNDATAAYDAVRLLTEKLCLPLVTEDFVVQSMPDVSPTKWHLAHTSWFFETFILKPYANGYTEFDRHFSYLFNSYYNAIGDRHCRQNRGQLSRPTVDEVYAYRAHIDEHMRKLLRAATGTELMDVLHPLVEVGIHHEQQHQELMLTDIKHVFWVNPLRPAYRPQQDQPPGSAPAANWISFHAGIREIGHEGRKFAFDNESPRHPEYVASFELGSRLITNKEFKNFIDDGGYDKPEFWLSQGWATVKAEEWQAPLYWIRDEKGWLNHTMSGLRPVSAQEPVTHVSFFEANAFARWAGARLPTEAEWETAAADLNPTNGTFVESEKFHQCVSTGSLRTWNRCSGDFPLAVDGELLFGLSRLSPSRGSLGRVQRKIHVQSICSSWGLRRHLAYPHPKDLPQFLPSRCPMAIYRNQIGPRPINQEY